MLSVASRFEQFRVANRVEPRAWYRKAGMSRAAFRVVRRGSDPYVSTVRRLIIAGSQLVGREVRAHELWDVGEDEPLPSADALPPRPAVSVRQRVSLKQYDTPLDRILRAEGLYPFFFAQQTALARQSLQRLRSAKAEPCMSTVGQIVRTLRRLTGKPYGAAHVFDVGEKLTPDDALSLWLRRVCK
jgi:hypothetical protein